jgi:hypothetical protein
MALRKFYDIEQAQLYLSDSVVRYDGEPVYIRTVMEHEDADHKRRDYLVEFNNIEHPNEHDAEHLSAAGWNFEPVPLGMVNMFKDGVRRVVDVSRMPKRAWRVGLNSNNISTGPVGSFRLPNNFGVHSLLFSTELKQTIKGIYPTFKEAVGMVEDENEDQCVAFSRRFAVGKEWDSMSLIYSKINNAVGVCDTEEPRLYEPYKYLQQALEECL